MGMYFSRQVDLAYDNLYTYKYIIFEQLIISAVHHHLIMLY